EGDSGGVGSGELVAIVDGDNTVGEIDTTEECVLGVRKGEHARAGLGQLSGGVGDQEAARAAVLHVVASGMNAASGERVILVAAHPHIGNAHFARIDDDVS